MKKILSLFTLLFSLIFSVSAQKQLNELPNFERYAKQNTDLPLPKHAEKRVVFIGNSITDGWVDVHPDFFTSNHFVGRGISGQTSPQLLLRFRQDVINLKPAAVVINIGTNDIAENTGKYNPVFTLDNIKSMAELAKANGIKVILSSVLPVGEYPWRKEIKSVPTMIDALNTQIKAYAEQKGFTYIDYNTAMRDENGAMKAGYANDGVHPTAEGYVVMEALAKGAIDKVLK